MSYIIRNKKNSTWRNSVLKNLVNEIIIHQRIETTPKFIPSLTKLLAKLIGWAKKDTLHSRRLALCYLKKGKKKILENKKHLNVVDVLFGEIKEKYKERNGGYTRVKKLFFRRGDGSLRVQISLV